MGLVILFYNRKKERIVIRTFLWRDKRYHPRTVPPFFALCSMAIRGTSMAFSRTSQLMRQPHRLFSAPAVTEIKKVGERVAVHSLMIRRVESIDLLQAFRSLRHTAMLRRTAAPATFMLPNNHNVDQLPNLKISQPNTRSTTQPINLRP